MKDDAEWEKRDTEAKWILFKKSISDGATLKNWIRFLEKKKDHEFLELVSLYQIDAFNHYGVGQILSQANAPNWLRLVHWIRGDKPPVRGHGWTVMDGLFLGEANQDVIHSWIKEHRLEDKYPTILQTIDGRKVKPKKVDVSAYLKPYQLADFLSQLNTPENLDVLPVDALRSEKGKVYLHQVLRAIDAMVISDRVGNPEVLFKLETLRRHPNERLRQGVYLAYTHLPPELMPLNLLKTAHDGKEPSKVREAAFLAHSYRNDPEIYPDVLAVASAPAHPAWEAAMSRLGEKIGGRVCREAARRIEVEG